MPLTAWVWRGVWRVGATLAAPGLRLMLHRRVAIGKEELARLPERYGVERQARPPGPLLWLHAASVGEAVSALPLLAAFPADITVLFTTGTRTSAMRLAQLLPGMGLRCQVLHRYVPLDVPAWAARFLDHWQPDAACFLESELWPNLLDACRRRAVPTALLNARMSERSARAWARAPSLARAVLGGFGFVAARSGQDADRLRGLGADPVVCWGDLKAAAAPLPADPARIAELQAQLGQAPRWLAASTHAGDDTVVLAVHRLLAMRYPGLITAIVPRHPERGVALAASLGTPRRGAGDPPPRHGGLWVADTLGELGLMYRCFPIVFMGKSFPPGGGQNPWEPSRLGCAVATGPHTANFEEANRLLIQAGALHRVADANGLADWVHTRLDDPALQTAMGRAALDASQAAEDLAPRLAATLLHLMAQD